MYYKIHGILNISGANTFIGSAKTRKQALEIVKTKVNSNIYPVFAITEHLRKSSIALGLDAGRTNNGMVTLSSSSIQYAKPYTGIEINHPVYIDVIKDEKDGAIFWGQHMSYFV